MSEDKADGFIKVTVAGVDPEKKDDVQAVINAEISKFDEFIQTKGGGHPLVRAEMALLRTYLLYKQQSAF